MESELVQGLEDVGYSGSLLDPSNLNKALQEGAKSTEFTGLVSWLADQISFFGKIDESIHPTSSPEDASSFLLELSTYLQELGCTNKRLTSGNANQRLSNVSERNTLLEYLITELMASKILEAKVPENNKTVEITISESITAKNMREMLTALKFQKPPDNITPELLFKKLHTKVSEVVKQVPKDLLGKPLFFGELNNNQWEKLDKVQGDLNEEYTIRREMLLKRLDVTVNSFTWSDRIRPKEDELNKCYHSKRDAMKREPDVTLAHLIAARDDLAIIEKTSNASVRKNTRSAINKVIIGAVPDRGGRPCEQEPPPPEMPSWQKDRVQGPQRGGFSGGGGRGGGRGGGQGSGAGFRDNKSVTSNFGQNFDNSQKFSNSNYGNQSGGFENTYSNQSSGYSKNTSSGYGNKSSNYGNQTGYSNQSSGYSNQNSGYGNQGSGYGNQGSGYGKQNSTGYSNQSGGYGNQGSGYSQSSNYGNQGSGYNQGYDRKSGGGDNKGGRGGRVQGGWNQGGDSSNYNQGGYNNRNQGYGGGRRY